MDKEDPAPGSSEPSVIKRFLELIRIGRAPDTTEDLEQEIQELIDEGQEQGLISSQESRMISSIFEFRDTKAYEIMTPRSDMVCVSGAKQVPEVVTLIIEEGFSRIPVYDGDLDHIIGILHAKDLLVCTGSDCQDKDLASFCKPAYFVSEQKPIVELLREFQSKKIHMAIVTDEFGSVRGLITLEDVLEEIVGDIDDEYDEEERRWRVLEDGSLLIYAKEDIEELEQFFGLALPEGPYESVGGLVIHKLGHLPRAGESVEVEGLVLTVIAATRRHIKTVRVKQAKGG